MQCQPRRGISFAFRGSIACIAVCMAVASLYRRVRRYRGAFGDGGKVFLRGTDIEVVVGTGGGRRGCSD